MMVMGDPEDHPVVHTQTETQKRRAERRAPEDDWGGSEKFLRMLCCSSLCVLWTVGLRVRESGDMYETNHPVVPDMPGMNDGNG